MVDSRLEEYFLFPKRSADVAVLEKSPKGVIDYCADLEKNIKSGKGLTLFGKPGTGKTCSMAVIAKAYCKLYPRRIGLIYIRTTNLLDMFMTGENEFQGWNLNDIKNTPLLFLDDFGMEYFDRGGYGISKFDSFIDYRYMGQLSTIISTNLQPKELKEKTELVRVVSRLRDKAWMKTIITTTDQRIKNDG